MPDLDEQIRTYLDSATTPVTAAEIMDANLVGLESARHARRLALAAVGLVAAAVLVTLLFLAGGADRSGEPGPVIAPAPTETTTPTVTVDAVPGIDQAELDGVTVIHALGEEVPEVGQVVWTRIEGTGQPVLVRDHDGYVIDGFTGGLLFSADGATWTHEPLSPELAGYDHFFPSREQWASGFADGERTTLFSDGEVWREVRFERDDGTTWDETDGAAATNVAIRSGTTWLIQDYRVGSYWIGRDGQLEYRRGPWQWPSLTEDELEQAHRPMVAPLLSILEAPDGGFVAFVSTYAPDDDTKVSTFEVWTSTDAENWTTHGTPAFVHDNYRGTPPRSWDEVLLIVADRGRYVSTDGVHWRQLEPREPVPETEDEPDRTRTGTGWIQQGFRVSADGESWTQLDIPTGFPRGGRATLTGDLIWDHSDRRGDNGEISSVIMIARIE